jgi:hypothetical protein
MAALQGANMVGADTRCTNNGTSSLFAFVKVAQPGDIFGSPSFIRSVRTKANAGIEPIDSLQVIFDNTVDCGTVGFQPPGIGHDDMFTFPNPAHDILTIQVPGNEIFTAEIRDLAGRVRVTNTFHIQMEMDISVLQQGIFFLHVWNSRHHFTQKIVKE